MAGVPIIGYFFRTPQPDEAKWVDLGALAEFPKNETRMITFDNPLRQPWDGVTAHTGVYVRYDGRDDRDREQFLVLAINCAHLGCPVSWFPQSGLFMCPCHGGVYYAERRASVGPAAAGIVSLRVANSRGTSWKSRLRTIPTLQDTLQDSPKSSV